MKNRVIRNMLALAVAVCFSQSVLAQSEIEKAEKIITAQWAKIKTLSAVTKQVSARKIAGVDVDNFTEGIYLHMKRDGKELFRQDLKPHQTLKTVDQQGEESYTITVVGDGTFVYNYSDVRSYQLADKSMQAGSNISIGGKSLLDDLRVRYKLQLKESVSLEDKEVFVIEGNANIYGRRRQVVCYISKDLGALLRKEMYENEKLKSTITIDNIEVNKEIPADRFKFALPKGVEIVDKSKKTNWMEMDE